MAARPVRFGHYLAYGSNDFLGAGAMSIIGFWILFFYTTFCGLTAVQAAAIFTTARLLDAFFSPVIAFSSARSAARPLPKYQFGSGWARFWLALPTTSTREI